jgi:cardiolipin synthase
LEFANLLTLSRILVVPVIFCILFFFKSWGIVFILVSLGALTDLLDGWVARRFSQETAWGRILDPLADKIFGLSLLGVLTVYGGIPLSLTLAMVLRDLLIMGGAGLLNLRFPTFKPRPLILGKVFTAVQMVTLVVAFAYGALMEEVSGLMQLFFYRGLLWGLWGMLFISLGGYMAFGWRFWTRRFANTMDSAP